MADSGVKRKKAKVAACGTRSGYQRHRNRGEEPCAACLAAEREAGDRYRSIPANAARARLHAKAAQLAKQELAKEYPHHYRELYYKYKAELFAEAENG